MKSLPESVFKWCNATPAFEPREVTEVGLGDFDFGLEITIPYLILYSPGARFFLRCRSRHFKEDCDFKHRCNTVNGYGTTEEAAKRHFLHEMGKLVDEHANCHRKAALKSRKEDLNSETDSDSDSDEPGDEMNPTWDAFQMKYLQKLQEKDDNAFERERARRALRK